MKIKKITSIDFQTPVCASGQSYKLTITDSDGKKMSHKIFAFNDERSVKSDLEYLAALTHKIIKDVDCAINS